MRAEKPASWVVTGIWLGLIALAVVALAAILLVYVPGHKRTFDDFGLRLPQATVAVLHFAEFFRGVWWILVPALLLVCCGVPLLVRHVARARTLGTVFAIIFLVLLLLADVLAVYAVNAPMAALTRGLSK